LAEYIHTSQRHTGHSVSQMRSLVRSSSFY
jgi:hypothetical protein